MTSEEILKVLTAARSPEQRALVNVDISLDGESSEVRRAVDASAIPHWFDIEILAALLEITSAQAEPLYGRLKGFSFIEAFHVHNAHNVHEVTRLALLDRLVRDDPVRYRELSKRAMQHFRGSMDPRARIEAVYHELVADPEGGTKSLDNLYTEWSDTCGMSGHLQTLDAAIEEHLQAQRLNGGARAMALLINAQIGCNYQPLGRTAEQLEKALEFYREANDEYSIANALVLLGQVRFLLGWRWQALKCQLGARAIYGKLVEANAANRRYRWNLFYSYVLIGDLELANKQAKEALATFEIGHTIAKGLHAESPEEHQADLVRIYGRIGYARFDLGQFEQARDSFDRELEIVEQNLAKFPNNYWWRRAAFVAHFHQGYTLFKLNLIEAAFGAYRSALQIAEKQVADDPKNTEHQRDLLSTINNIGEVLSAQDPIEAALPYYERARAFVKDLIALDPDNALWQADLEEIRTNIATLQKRLESAQTKEPPY